MELKVDPEFRDAIQPLSHEERAQLEANIKSHAVGSGLAIVHSISQTLGGTGQG